MGEIAEFLESKLGGVCRQIDVFVIEKPRGSVQIKNMADCIIKLNT